MRLKLLAVQILILASFHTLLSQETGVPTEVLLQSGQTTLSLDFSEQDYQLILYSAVRDEQDSTRTYSFTVGGAFPASKPSVFLQNPEESTTNYAKSILRREEAELARQHQGRPLQFAEKRATPFQIGDTRSFAFEEIGDVSTQNVTATLVATSSRAEAWVDNNISRIYATNPNAITTAEAQAQINRFSETTYPVVTSVFGDPSDVDGDGKLLFLYTELVDQAGGIAGFYRAKSLFSASDGGDGNAADMMYIGLAGQASTYESLLAHEFQHLISYNQHVLIHEGVNEISSINEAMSHVAEDLIGQHVQGGNANLVRTYAKAPEIYSILSESKLDKGVRGTAYTFVRSMIESFGDDVLSSLVKTELSGIANVEAVSGQTFEQVYETYLARMFLAGSGLNTSFDYAYPFFTDPSSGGRSIPIPNQSAVSPEAVTVTGSTKAFAASSIRLMGAGTSTITIDSEVAGLFKGILIPIPRNFRHDLAFKPDFFAGYTFDGPILSTFTTGQSSRFSGTTTISEATELQFRFDPLVAGLDTLRFRSKVTNGTFSINVLFPHNRAGNYELSIYNLLQDESFPQLPYLFQEFSFVGRIPVATVLQGTGAIDIPADFFTGIQFESALTSEIEAGEALSVSGTIADPTVNRLLLRFTNPTTGEIVHDSYIVVTSGAFEELIIFTNEQVGTYELSAYTGLHLQTSLPFVGLYPGFSVMASTGPFTLPTEFFDGFILHTKLPTEFLTGKGFSLSGSVTDTALEEVLFRFTAEDGSEIRFHANVNQGLGTFRKGMIFFPTQAGSYKLDVFAGQSGQSLPFKGTFSPILVSAGQGPVLLPVDIFDGLILNEPMNTELVQGSSPRLIGKLSDHTPTGIAIRLELVDGSITGDSKRGTISNGQVDLPIPIEGLATGDYDLLIFAGQSGQSLPFLSRFGPLSVTTSQPRVSLGVTSLNFDATEIGQSSQLSVAVSNVGSQNLTISEVSVVSGSFIASTSATSASAGGSLIVSVTYNPSSAGVETGVLTIKTNDPTRPSVSVNLQGTGLIAPLPQIALSTNTINYAETLAGTSSTLVFFIKNTGVGSLVVDSLTVEGPFSTPSISTTIQASGSQTVVITFSPTVAGTFDGRVLVFSNASTDPLVVVLTATASAPVTTPPVAGIPTEPALLGDINGNGLVDFSDFLQLAGAFGSNLGESNYVAGADLDDSGSINFSDFLIFASQYGKSR